jgi:DNA-binding CsgD family transcriptional regulator
MQLAKHREYLQCPIDVAFGDRGPLSPREHEALVCTAEGLTSKGVAQVMGCTVRTANCHIESAMNKLGAKNRVHLVWVASSRGFIVPVGFVAYSCLVLNLVLGFVLLCVFHTFLGIAIAGSISPSDPVRQPVRQTRTVRLHRMARRSARREGWAI